MECNKPYNEIKEEVLRLLTSSIKERASGRLGLLFSGGLDSVLLARLLKDIGIEFTCYIAGVVIDGCKEPEDLAYARKAANELGLELKERVVGIKEFETVLKKVVKLGNNDVVNAGIASALWLACERASHDGVEVMLSGLGSEEIFADYERHRKAKDVNKECAEGFLRMDDVPRDDIVGKSNGMEMKAPYLDDSLVKFALSIPGKYKVKDGMGKMVLRELAMDLGVSKELALRRKKAAQYGSNADKAIAKLAKINGYKYKSEYVNNLKPKIAALFSTGKDSAYALYLMRKKGYDVKCLVTIESSNPDSYMYHTPNVKLASLQAEAMGLPILTYKTSGVKEEELDDLRKALEEAKEKYGVEGVVTGALYSSYQRERIEGLCKGLGLEAFSPLWHMGQEQEMRSLIREGFKVIMVAIASDGLDKGWLGKVLEEKDVDKLSSLANKHGFNVAGEGGEFESFVLDCPLFSKKLVIEESSVSMESENCGKMVLGKVRLEATSLQ
ncbi:MAG: diphthine--ammonia ligase [Candidatus Woesearchaeota archaeon]